MSAQISTGAGTTGRAAGGKFLTFFLGSEEYGIEILRVQEIIGTLPLTPVPGLPSFTRGVINLRGSVIPVFDLRSRLRIEPVEGQVERCIIVVRSGSNKTGVLVDMVSEVLSIPDEQIEAPPSFGTDDGSEFLLGIGRAEGKIRLLLSIDKVLG